jgi:hypothetical protein
MEIEEKIEALLNKAGSTTFEEESALFYAKAQELMLKYAISEEQLWQSDPSKTQKPILEVLNLKGDNSEDRFKLLHVLAMSNRSKAWLHNKDRREYIVHIAGYPSDIAYIQSLYASLLQQMNLACVSAEFTAAWDNTLTKGGVRTWRVSFTEGYCERVRIRIWEAHKQTQTEQTSTDLVVQREAKVAEYIANDLGIQFSPRKALVRANKDHRGVAAGRSAAENAELSLKDKLSQSKTQLGG